MGIEGEIIISNSIKKSKFVSIIDRPGLGIGRTKSLQIDLLLVSKRPLPILGRTNRV